MLISFAFNISTSYLPIFPTSDVFAGCRDNQTSADAYLKGSYNGAFTYYMCKHLREAQSNITRMELIKRVRASLGFNGFSQIPQLECQKSEKGKKVLE